MIVVIITGNNNFRGRHSLLLLYLSLPIVPAFWDHLVVFFLGLGYAHTADPHTPHTCENISSSLGICENIAVVIARAGGWPVGRNCVLYPPIKHSPQSKIHGHLLFSMEKLVMQRYGLLPSYHLCLIIGFSPIALWYGIPTYPSLIKHGNGKRPISFTDDFPALNLHL